jgi:hypothetical protein
MAKSFEVLPNELTELGRKIQRGTSVLAIKAATVIGATVVDTTRVDTGKARSNWRASLGQPLKDTIPPYAAGNNLGIGETANASAAKAQQRSVIRQFRAFRDIGDIYITNNVKYIGFLNDGSSRVPAGNMVAQGIQAGSQVVRNARILVRG